MDRITINPEIKAAAVDGNYLHEIHPARHRTFAVFGDGSVWHQREHPQRTT